MNITFWMHKKVVMIDADKLLGQAIELFEQHRFRHLPVVQEGKVVGMITPADINRVLPSALNQDETEETVYLIENTTVAAAMSSPPITIHASASLLDAIVMMRRNKIDSLPVIDNQESPIGIISITDILQAFHEIMSTTGGDTRYDLRLDRNGEAFYSMIEVFKQAHKEILAIFQHYDFSKDQQLVTVVISGHDNDALTDALWQQNITIEKISSSGGS